MLALATLFFGVWAGLLRMGWGLPVLRATLPMSHGPLMVGGFLGTLISLERAVGLGDITSGRARRLYYAAPLLTGLGAILILLGVRHWSGPLLITLGSAGLLIMMIQIYRLHAAPYVAVIGLGALVWLIGNLLWLFGASIPEVVLWWVGFLVFTIAGERLELSRLLQLPRQVVLLFQAAVVGLLAGLVLSIVSYDLAVRVAGLGMVALALWLLRYDIARRRLSADGQARFIAISLLSGYVWLAIAGGLALVYGGITAGPYYDAWLHAIFLGFVFSMIFAHALIIFPAVLGRPMAFLAVFYAHLVLLHISLILRLYGDLAVDVTMRQWGGMLNAAALLLFLVNTIFAVVLARHRNL